MAKLKNVVEYFPHFVNDGKTIFILETAFGNDGYCFWYRFLELLGKTDGHFLDVNDAETWEYFLAYTNVDDQKAEAILDKLKTLKKIDKKLWKNRILWCQTFVDNLKEVYRKRKRSLPSKPQHSVAESAEELDISSQDSPQAKQPVAESIQSKVEKSRVEKSKEDSFFSSVENPLKEDLKSGRISHHEFSELLRVSYPSDYEFLEKSSQQVYLSWGPLNDQSKKYNLSEIMKFLALNYEYFPPEVYADALKKAREDDHWKDKLNIGTITNPRNVSMFLDIKIQTDVEKNKETNDEFRYPKNHGQTKI